MSSFGSCGSSGGAGVVERGRDVSTPKPVSLSKPGGADVASRITRMSSKICVLSSVGRAVQTQAVAPETIGAEKLVPSSAS